jgi:peptidylprolyl isomerase
MRLIAVFLFVFVFMTGFSMTDSSAKAAGKYLVLTTSQGPIKIELLPDLAPNHVARISQLADEGFYDGIIFHRVIPGFMAQTGDPTGTGMGGSGEKLKAEFTDYPYQEGTVGMARAMNPDSADSQFFICFDGCGHLTGQYTVWGQVAEGMDTVYKITPGEPPATPDRILSAALSD